VELRCVQKAMMDEYFKRDSERGLFPTFAWFVEEVGELGEALLKRDKAGVSEELADVIAWALSIANLVGIDVEEALRLKYGEVLLKGSASSCDRH